MCFNYDLVRYRRNVDLRTPKYIWSYAMCYLKRKCLFFEKEVSQMKLTADVSYTREDEKIYTDVQHSRLLFVPLTINFLRSRGELRYGRGQFTQQINVAAVLKASSLNVYKLVQMSFSFKYDRTNRIYDNNNQLQKQICVAFEI